MKHLRRALLLLSVMVCGTAAWAQGTLTIGIAAFPTQLHPAIDALATKSYVLAMARRPVSTYDKDWRLVCMLCETLPNLADGSAREIKRADGTRTLELTYRLRDDLFWADGVKVTTKDVRFAWEVGRHPQSGYVNADLYARQIADIRIVDERTFIVTRDKYTCDYAASLTDFSILPAHIEQKRFAENPAEYRNRNGYQTDPTNPGLYLGPYRIASLTRGTALVLERNAHWKGPRPAFDRITVRAIENTAAMEAALLSGAIDYIAGEGGMPIDQAVALERRFPGRFNVIWQPSLVYAHIDVNLDNPILRDVRVRRALMLAADRAQIRQRLLQERVVIAHHSLNPLDRHFTDQVRQYPGDAKAAEALLEEAGWKRGADGIRVNAKGERLQIEFLAASGNRQVELVQQVLQANWRKVGIEARIEQQVARVFFGQTLDERRFTGLAMFSWLSAPDSIPRTTLHSSQIPTAENAWAGQNYPGYRDAEMDAILDGLETQCAPAENAALWRRLQEKYAEDLPALPLWFRSDAFFLPKWLQGVEPTGHQYPTTLWIENWRRAPS
jgi:peptide/nickel transport system substrate-binding protein